MPRYLSPKGDIVFKKIFGDHPHLLRSFLNAVLPLPADRQIVSLEYLAAEQVPVIPTFKRNIIDVKCKDNTGRIFIVEMQMDWGTSFMQRLLFGAAQAYVKQLRAGEGYHLLHDVYGLGLIDDVFDKESEDWYHHYGMVRVDNPKKAMIDGLSLVFVELPKFKPSSLEQKKLKVLWLRFMRELDETTEQVDAELWEQPDIKEAIQLLEEAAYTKEELACYEDYWKQVSAERSLFMDKRMEGKAEGLAEGKAEEKIFIAKKLLQKGMDMALIAEITGLAEVELTTIMLCGEEVD